MSKNDDSKPKPSKQLAWSHYATIPKGHYCEMAGIERAQAIRHADRYGIPLKGRSVNLPQVLEWLHAFLSENWRLFAEREGEVVVDNAPQATQAELVAQRTRLLTAQASKEELNLAERQADLIPVEDFRVYWELITSKLRGAIDVIQRRWGPETAEIFESALREADAEARKIGGDDA